MLIHGHRAAVLLLLVSEEDEAALHSVRVHHKKGGEKEQQTVLTVKTSHSVPRCNFPSVISRDCLLFFSVFFWPGGRRSSAEGRWNEDVLVKCFCCVFDIISLFLSGRHGHPQPAALAARPPAASSNLPLSLSFPLSRLLSLTAGFGHKTSHTRHFVSFVGNKYLQPAQARKKPQKNAATGTDARYRQLLSVFFPLVRQTLVRKVDAEHFPLVSPRVGRSQRLADLCGHTAQGKQ